MTSPPPQPTRFETVVGQLGRSVQSQLGRSWRGGSLVMLGLLIGYWLGQNLTSLWLEAAPAGRPGAVLGILLLIEVSLRIRSRWLKGEPGLGWLVVDNLRIGLTYAVVLEAFKLGS